MKDSSTATERVGRYQLLEPIGGGPNGSVARAKVFGVAGFERQFAVKRFLPELALGPAAQALSAAARSYGSLEHPRIARMSEFGVAQGQTFTAVEYVAGLDVFRLLQEAKLASVAIAAGGALALVSQAARAVGYAHGRGLSHLGLAPTNVIVTADGDVKVTDFGICASTMPPRPAEASRLASRVPYLAPEQIAGEATSAATDVFVLGVIAYELVTGQRAYRGDGPAAIAQAILAGPPIEPALPRPIVRVLQRCLARSPFERFPDARALADALDAALRVAPVPGTRKDVGAQVKTTLERYAALNEGNVSGMVALNLTGSAPTHDDSSPVNARRPEARTEPSPMPTFSPPSPSTPIPRMSGLAGPASTMKEMPKPTATMTGLAPPPIPVPPGVSPPPGAAPILPTGTSTIPGMTPPKKLGGIPAFPKPSPPPPPKVPFPPAKVGSLTQGWDAMPDPTEGAPASVATVPDPIASITDEPVFELSDDGAMPPHDPATVQGLAARRPTPGQSFDSTTGEMSMAQLDALNRKAQLATAELAPVQAPGVSDVNRPDDVITRPVDISSMPIEASAADSLDDFAVDAPSHGPPADPSSTMPSLAPPPPVKPVSQPSLSVPNMPAPATSQPELASQSAAATAPARTSAPPSHPVAPPTESRLPKIAAIVLGVGLVGAAGFYAYNEFIVKKSDEPVVAQGPESASAADVGSARSDGSGSAGSQGLGSDDSAPPGSAGSTAGSDGSAADAVGSDAVGSDGSGSAEGSAVAMGSDAADGSAAGSDTGSVANTGSAGSADPNGSAPQVQPSGTSDQLEVASTPAGARVFLDGAEQGKTPMKLPGTGDRHTLAVLLPGHDLYLAEVDGAGVYNVTLAPVKLAKSGPGIKIEKCKAKGRYYIYVDGQPSGQTCPTSKRIVTTLGAHVVEVYDIVTETRKKYDINIVDDRLSVRVKIDE